MPNTNDTVDAKTRYSAAQTEINSRLQIRATLSTQYLFALGVAAGAVGASLNAEVHPALVAVATCVFPAISWYFITLMDHNDRIVGLIVAYCRALEQVSLPTTPHLPRWFSKEHGLFDRSSDLRGKHSRAMIYLNWFAGITPSAWLVIISLTNYQAALYQPWFLVVCLSFVMTIICAALLHLKLFRISEQHQISESSLIFDEQHGKFVGSDGDPDRP